MKYKNLRSESICYYHPIQEVKPAKETEIPRRGNIRTGRDK